MCCGIRIHLILHLISFLYRLITQNKQVFTAIFVLVPKETMAMSFLKLLILAQTTLMLMEMKLKMLYFTFKKWPAGQLYRLIIFPCMEKLPAWQFILQLTKKMSMPLLVMYIGVVRESLSCTENSKTVLQVFWNDQRKLISTPWKATDKRGQTWQTTLALGSHEKAKMKLWKQDRGSLCFSRDFCTVNIYPLLSEPH